MATSNFDARSNLKLKVVFQRKQKNVITPFYTSKVKLGRLARMTKLGSTPVLQPPAGKQRKLNHCFPPEILQTPRSRPTSSNLKRNSISLVELTNSSKMFTQKKLIRKQQGNNSKLNHAMVSVDRKCSISITNRRKECELAAKVYKTFLLNAWRRCRNQVSTLQSKTQQLEQEVENCNNQIVLMQSLLESEKLRVAVVMSDYAHLKSRLELELKNTELIKKEIDNLKAENFNLVKLKQNMDLEEKSLRTELISAEVKCKNYQGPSGAMQRELTLTRQWRLESHRKLEDTEHSLKKKNSSVEAMWVSTTKLQEELTNLRYKYAKLQEERDTKDNESNEQINKIKEMNEEIILLQKKCKVQQDNIVNLHNDFDLAKEKINEQGQTIESLNRVVKQFEKEEKELDKNLLKTRNKIIFQSIRMCAGLLIPTPPNIM